MNVLLFAFFPFAIAFADDITTTTCPPPVPCQSTAPPPVCIKSDCSTSAWPQGRVPVVIDSAFSPGQKRNLRRVMQLIERDSCGGVNFVAYTDETHFVSIDSYEPRTVCTATSVGMTRDEGSVPVLFGSACFRKRPGIMMHELLHILGFDHEHVRPDRDEFVHVNVDNILPFAADHFARLQNFTPAWRRPDGSHFPYDYDSLMHYKSDAFSRVPQRLETLTPVVGASVDKERFGQRRGLSPLDKLRLRSLYSCVAESAASVENPTNAISATTKDIAPAIKDETASAAARNTRTDITEVAQCPSEMATCAADAEPVCINADCTTSTWPQGRVPIVIDSAFSRRLQRIIRSAMKQIERDSCNGVHFVQRTEERHYLSIVQPKQRSVCYSSSTGKPRNEGSVRVLFGQTCFRQLGNLMHELLHILGFHHEHVRPDRDQFVQVNVDNILPFAADLFARLQNFTPAWRRPDGSLFPYDYDSLMHYKNDALSRVPQRLETLTPVVGASVDTERFGQRRGLSPLDKLRLRSLYPCAADSSASFEKPTNATSASTEDIARAIKDETASAATRNTHSDISEVAQCPSELATCATDAEPVCINADCTTSTWPQGRIPYVMESGFSDDQQRQVYTAMYALEDAACRAVRYVGRSFPNDRYLAIRYRNNSSICAASSFGMPNDKTRVIVVLSDHCFQEGVGELQHDLLHILGFAHEHTRPDRDEFVQVHERKIAPRERRLFEKLDEFSAAWRRTDGSVFPYDYDSLMHYASNIYSTGGLDTLTPVGDDVDTVRLGQRRGLSETDTLRLRSLYRCKSP